MALHTFTPHVLRHEIDPICVLVCNGPKAYVCKTCVSVYTRYEM